MFYDQHNEKGETDFDEVDRDTLMTLKLWYTEESKQNGWRI